MREFLRGRVAFEKCVFSEPQFPAVAYLPEEAAQAFIGPYQIHVAFYDREHRAVKEAAVPGPYAAVVELVPETGRTVRRFVTLYRAAKPIDGTHRFDAAKLDEIATWTGLTLDDIQRQSALIIADGKDRVLGDLARDPRTARLFAGIALTPPGDQPQRKNSDAFAHERQWWVELKRQLSDAAQRWPTPVVAPQHLNGKPAPVVREGTLAEAGMKPDAAEKIDAVLGTWAADTDEAFSVCIVRRSVIVLHRAYGTRDGHPMTLLDKSWMASVTKTMSATLMMMLVDRGLASLDDPIERFLPQFRDAKVATPITLRHLYTHTSGLADWPGWNDELADVEDQAADCYPFVKVGKKWAYNGQGYTLGGKIIETISGEAIPRFFLRHLLVPLGMENTDVIATHADAQTVPLDMARFAQLLLNRGSYGDREFFRPETFAMMLPKLLTDVLGPDATKSFGIGLDGQPGSGKFGHGTASAATFQIDANDELIVIMCRNKPGANFDKYNGQFQDAVRAGIAADR